MSLSHLADCTIYIPDFTIFLFSSDDMLIKTALHTVVPGECLSSFIPLDDQVLKARMISDKGYLFVGSGFEPDRLFGGMISRIP